MFSFLRRNKTEHIKPVYPLSWVTDNLAVGHAPMSFAELQSIREQGIDAIMNLCLEFEDLVSIEKDQGFEVYYLPMPDEEVPEMQELEESLIWLDEALYLGKKVLIHCRHGIGRTGTIVSSYMLRKGLGQKLTQKKLKGFRSQPTQFCQFKLLRHYGKKHGRLTLREPSLEMKSQVNLSPFFEDLKAVLQGTVELTASDQPLCGRDHEQCCFRIVSVSLIEAVFIHHQLNKKLTREDRLDCIEKGVNIAQLLKQAPLAGGAQEEGLSEEEVIKCPLNKEHKCQLFDCRPVQCRLSDLKSLSSDQKDQLDSQLSKVSQNLYFAFTGSFMEGSNMEFNLHEVVSGKFVQKFFYHLAQKANLS